MESHRNGPETSVEVELRGLSIYTHHGVSEAEREVGQRMEFDVSFDVPDCDATLTDRLEDTVDYAEACDIVALAATERNYRTLERLCKVIGERLMELDRSADEHVCLGRGLFSADAGLKLASRRQRQ